jgi:hypothetical protein
MNWVSKLGQNIQFVAFFAHAGVAALLVEHLPGNALWWALSILVIGGGKEYWYDAKYEQNPPQTFWDNTEDFLGYAVGALAGYALAK